MDTIPQVAEAMKEILTTKADALARSSGFVQRQRKLSGSSFAQTLVFGWLHNPEVTLSGLAQQATKQGVALRAQSLAERFQVKAATFLRQLLEAAVSQVMCGESVLIPLLQRFAGVYLQDGTVLSLPAALQPLWPGTRTSHGEARAALKVQVRFDFSSGAIDQLHLQAGREQDRAAALQRAPLPPGSLRLADLGYFSLRVLREFDEQGVYFLTRIQVGTQVLAADGTAYTLSTFLTRFEQDGHLDAAVRLGKGEQLPCRLLAWRVPQAVAQQRRRRIYDQARKQQKAPSAEALTLAAWTCVATNAPQALLTLAEAEVLLCVRWQIELLFKLWKSHGQLDQSRSANPDRILCEVYAKLLALLIQHWLLVATCWSFPDRSLTKAVQTLRTFIQTIADQLQHLPALCATLQRMQDCLTYGCRTEKRHKEPSTYQLLTQFA